MTDHKISIMLIDDSEVDTYLIQEVVKESGFSKKFITYSSSSESLEYILNIKNPDVLPDLILIDVNMPVIDGYELIDSIADEYDEGFSPVVFIVTSSLQMRDYESFDKQYTATEFLKKPLDLNEFKAKVSKYFPQLK